MLKKTQKFHCKLRIWGFSPLHAALEPRQGRTSIIAPFILPYWQGPVLELAWRARMPVLVRAPKIPVLELAGPRTKTGTNQVVLVLEMADFLWVP